MNKMKKEKEKRNPEEKQKAKEKKKKANQFCGSRVSNSLSRVSARESHPLGHNKLFVISTANIIKSSHVKKKKEHMLTRSARANCQ